MKANIITIITNQAVKTHKGLHVCNHFKDMTNFTALNFNKNMTSGFTFW